MDAQSVFGPVATRPYQISDFDRFILTNVPYGVVHIDKVHWGAIEYDGPDGGPGLEGAKPALQWHFGGVPYPITRAVRIHYTYVRTWDGSNDEVTTALLFGFQRNLANSVQARAIPFVPAPSATFRTRVQNLGTFGGFSSQAWGSDAAILASEAGGVVKRAFQQPLAAGMRLRSAERLRRFQQGLPIPTFAAFLQNELRLGDDEFATLMNRTVAVDFDGPASDSESLRPFRYTVATLANDPDPYSRVLFWYFAGKPFRLTKALRIPLNQDGIPRADAPANGPASIYAQQADVNSPSLVLRALAGQIAPDQNDPGEALFIGFVGPGSDPSA